MKEAYGACAAEMGNILQCRWMLQTKLMNAS